MEHPYNSLPCPFTSQFYTWPVPWYKRTALLMHLLEYDAIVLEHRALHGIYKTVQYSTEAANKTQTYKSTQTMIRQLKSTT